MENVFDASGNSPALWWASHVPANSQIFADGQRIALRGYDGQTYFIHQDWVGTDRVHTDPSGNVAGTWASLPFGDGGSMTGSGAGTTDFGRFADMESSGDTFVARFRQYNQTIGRWMSPDPYAGSYDLRLPQSLNRYTYVRNRPLSGNDPRGLNPCYTGPSDMTDEDLSDADNWEDVGYAECQSDGGMWYGGPSTTVDVNANSNNSAVTIITTSTGQLTSTAPSNGTPTTPRTPQQCASAALKKNAVALTLDAAGVGAGFLPGGELVVAGAQATISVASEVNSAVGGDGVGSALGVLGLPAAYAGTAAKFFGVGVKAIPGIGTAISALGALNDAYSTYQDYQACLAGH